MSLPQQSTTQKADDLLRLIIQHQPGFLVANLANSQDAGASVAKQLLEFRKKLIEGLGQPDR